MNFKDFTNEILKLGSLNDSTNCYLTEFVGKINKITLMNIVKEIGTIPENIEASSSAEKLFSKASDLILARCFEELGMLSSASKERGNSADIIAKSRHGYTLVADAKTFRLSRTAKNQKDFKIDTLSNWRGVENDFALLVAPYFQYPNDNSQIYSSALDKQVCLFSWEHILFLLQNNISESDSMNLELIWNAPKRIVRDTKIVADKKDCHLPYINKMLCDRISLPIEKFNEHLKTCKNNIQNRGKIELLYLNDEQNKVRNLTRDEAIKELLKNKKIDGKIVTIEKFINALFQRKSNDK